MSDTTGPLDARFRAALAEYPERGTVVVAVSGGLDSTVLLHLARFAGPDSGYAWVAAHFDHAMRPSSADDARWVAGLCRAWGVRLHAERARGPLRSEAEARGARYDFLERVGARAGASLVLTAHHADDQAETVLFRLLRGTGGAGMAGIPARRSPRIVRPLLDFWRSELLDYARRVRLSWRDDPTNRSEAYARNVIRHRILPDAERLVAPGARGALVRLARVAAEDEAAWASVLPALMRPLELRDVEGGLSFARARLLEMHPAVRARVIRALAERLGEALDHAATRLAVDFAARAASGRAIDLGGRLSLGVELERCVLGRPAPPGDDRPLSIPGPARGRGSVILGGSAISVAWGEEEPPGMRSSERFDLGGLRFPLVVRSRRPGDRIRVSGGTKKVKKVMLERRIPPSERHRVPLVVDAEGSVLWIPGVASAEGIAPERAGRGLSIGIGG
jgi:tRNA(Ile)-lysidine synthase